MSNTSVLLTCASVLDRLSSWCEVQDLSWLDLKSLQSLDNLGEFIFQWLGSLASFHVGFVFLACQYYQDLIWFCKSIWERKMDHSGYISPFYDETFVFVIDQTHSSSCCHFAAAARQVLPGHTWHAGAVSYFFVPVVERVLYSDEQPTSGRCVRRKGRIVNQCPHVLSIWEMASIRSEALEF